MTYQTPEYADFEWYVAERRRLDAHKAACERSILDLVVPHLVVGHDIPPRQLLTARGYARTREGLIDALEQVQNCLSMY